MAEDYQSLQVSMKICENWKSKNVQQSLIYNVYVFVIVKLRQGSGKDCQGMVTKRPLKGYKI